MKYVTVKLTEQQLWQVDYLVSRDIQRLEKVVIDRITTGKSNNKTFGASLAFNIRLLGVLRKAKS
jgi:hypothetical protein